MAEDVRITARVAQGAAYLDREQPGWLDRIDVIALDLNSPCGCILGQLHGGYERAPQLGRDEYGNVTDEAARWVADHGFYAEAELEIRSGPEIRAEYAALTEAWRDLIEQRISGLVAAGVTGDGA